MMNIIELNVPDYVRYISDWTDYKIPEGHCIVDKDICGCGYTEYCIRPENPFDTILCSPRIVLLENKYEQHLGDPGLFYFENQGIKKEFMDANGIKTEKTVNRKYNQEFQSYTREKLMEHMVNCRILRIPARILCTYDSFYIIKNAIGESLRDFRVIVDEFQSLFADSFFKPETEAEFFRTLQDVPNVTYLSATPMLEKYLEKLDGFKDLPFYKMKWPDFRISEATVHEKWVSDVEAEALKIIHIYKNSRMNRPWKDVGGIPVYSNEVIFYINSVSAIKRIISKAKLLPSECTIICSRTDSNKKTIEGIRSLDPSQSFKIDKVPGRNDSRRMFTFCTKTTYLGADFYSDNAYTVVLSDANIQSLVVDVRLDLPQILGRQRLLENPWKNECVIFYKTSRIEEETDFTEEEFYRYLNAKDKDTKKIISSYLDFEDPDKLIKSVTNYDEKGRLNYFISLDSHGKPVMNELMKIAEERAWEMTRKEHRNRVNVIRSISESKYVTVDTYQGHEDVVLSALKDQLSKLSTFDQKLELYCEFREKFKNDPAITSKTVWVYRGTDYENYYSYFGIDVCRAVSFRAGELKKKISDESLSSPLKKEVYSIFKLKTRYSLKDIKYILTDLYKRLGIKKTAKASDISDFFNVQQVNLYDSTTKKRTAGYELISIK